MCIDLSNNFHYGLLVSGELAAVMVLAAFGVTALPAAAALRGWDWLVRLGTAACVLLTVWAAFSAYADKQGSAILAAQAGQASYQDARADAARARQEIEAARSEMASISETLPASQLQQLLDAKLAAARQHERWSPTKGCQDVTIPISREFCDQLAADKQALLVRIGQAKAKEDARARIEAAQSRLDAAMGEAKAGPAQTSMLAEFIAERTGREAADIARTIALATTGFAIIVTILMACLMHQAVQLITQGLGMQEEPARNEDVTEDNRAARATAVATLPATTATPVATTLEATPKPKRGSREYWLARLRDEHPTVAARVETGELSCYAACLETGLRKRPANDWTKPERYTKPAIRAVT
jgi:hypothetical protein